MRKIIDPARIINGIGGDPRTGMCSCPVPGHGKGNGDQKPSLWISPKGDGLKCKAGCTYKSVVAAIRARGIEVHYEGQRSSSTKPKTMTQAAADLDEAQRFLDLLDPKAKSWTFQTFDDNHERKNSKLANIWHGTLDGHAYQLRKLSKYDSGIFVCPNRTDGKGRKKENIVAIRAVSVDLDGSPLAPVQECELTPHAIIETSPGRYQAHWRVKDLPLDEFEGITRGIAQRFGGDPNIAELAHCARLPGFDHAKDSDNRFQVRLIEANERPAYTAEQIRTAFPPEDKACRANIDAKLVDRSERRMTTRPASTFKTKRLEWLWKPFFPRGKATTVFGDGGVGKSTVVISVIARLTRGERMPVCKGEALSGSALILTKEDDIETVVKPRLEVAGADLDRVHLVGYDVPDDPEDFDPVDSLDTSIAELEKQIIKHGDVGILVIDPVSDFCGKLSPKEDNEVRQLLIPLARLARKYNLALVIVAHINKDQMQAAHHRGLGSVAWRNVPRSAVLLADDPEVGGRKVMVQTKANLTDLGRDKNAVGLTMRGVKDWACVVWEDQLCNADPEQLLAKRKPKTKLDQAKEVLQDWLKDGSMLRDDIKWMSEAENIGWRTMVRAKKELRVVSFKRQGEAKYRWRLPRKRRT